MKKFFFLGITALLLLNFTITAQNTPKFSGVMFGDIFYNASQNNPANNDQNGIQFRRINFTADFTISEKFSTRFRMESDQSNNSNTQGNKLGFMVKDAYLQWKGVFEGSNLVAGISPTPAFSVAEGVWGNRYLEKTTLDFWGIVSSRDFGIDLMGNLYNNGQLKYWVKIGNNSGNAPENNKYKRFYGMLEYNPTKEFVMTAYGDFAPNAMVYDQFAKSSKSNNSFVGAVFLGYKKENFNIGLEAFLRSQQNGFKKSNLVALEDLDANGFSIWANYSVSENFRFVGRYDSFDPNSNTDNDGNSFFLFALDYMPVPKIHISPNVIVKTYQKGGDDDIVPRLTFSWEF